MDTFDQIYVLDLHGNSNKREQAPEGGSDQNVFDIQQGVAIAVFVKKSGLRRGVWHSDLWGKRLEKYQALCTDTMESTGWCELTPSPPYYFFVPFPAKEMRAYSEGWLIPDIFSANVAGVITARDSFAIAFEKSELEQRLARFVDQSYSTDEIRATFKLKDTRGWKLHGARAGVSKEEWENWFEKITYRPFDDRWIAYSPKLVDWGREQIMRWMLEENIALLSTRITKDDATFFCSQQLVGHKAASVYDISYLYPLYRYQPNRIENLAPDFRAFIDERYEHHYAPEEILGYVYAILHARTYRERYAEFLRIDFPRIPFAEDGDNFEALSGLGWDLMQKHLLRDVPNLGLGGYQGRGQNDVEKPRYVSTEEALYINDTQNFAPIPEAVWNFHVGGYQVLSKYLKDRKGRTLTLDEINNVENVANVLAFTLTQMTKIDEAYKDAFPKQG